MLRNNDKSKKKGTESSVHAPINSLNTKRARRSLSKLSRGPANPHHATYIYNGKRVRKSLCKRLSDRSINVRAKELYEDAGITSPTFYLHFRDSNDVLSQYEQDLETDFYEIVPPTKKREVVFVILTEYIVKNRQYFLATHHGDNYSLLKKIIYHYRLVFVSEDISDRSFANYAGTLIVTINCWLCFDKLDKISAAKCAQRLKMIRVVKVD